MNLKLKLKLKDIVTKKINIFGKEFYLDKLIVTIIWAGLSIQSIIYIILYFISGPFYLICIYIFLFSIQVGFAYFNILTNKMRLDNKL